jgi:hypothetical protein
MNGLRGAFDFLFVNVLLVITLPIDCVPSLLHFLSRAALNRIENKWESTPSLPAMLRAKSEQDYVALSQRDVGKRDSSSDPPFAN